MKKRVLSLLLAFSLLGSAITVNAAEAGNVRTAEKTNIAEEFEAESADNLAEETSEGKEQESGSVSERESAEETESTAVTESTEETERAEEAESAEETERTEETESAEETERAEETESTEETERAEEAESAEETESTAESESIEEPTDTEETESIEETAEMFLPEDELLAETAEEMAWNEVLTVAPGYRGIYSEDDIRAFLAIQAEDELVGTEAEPAVFDSYEDAVAYLRAQMKARKVEISLEITDVMMDGDGWIKMIDDALEENENTPADEGDYIRANYLGAKIQGNIRAVVYTFSYTADAAQEEEVTAALGPVMESLALDGKSDYEKIKAIHDYIVEHITYDNDGTHLCHSTYAALVQGKCVCQGYASLFQRMCKQAGLPVRYIVGDVDTGEHAWNIVKLGDVWYNVDTTWDDPTGGSLRYTYFLKSDMDFEDHIRDKEYLTDEFYAQHPMAQLSYGEEIIGQNRANCYYSFLGTDGESFDTAASVNPKILIFYDADSVSKSTLQGISQSGWIRENGVDVYAISCSAHTAEAVAAYRDKYCPEGYIKFGYAEDNTALSSAIYYMRRYGVVFLSYPVIAMIDGNNRVQYVTEGYLSAKKMETLYIPTLEKGDPNVKPLTSLTVEPSRLTLKKGETAELRTAYTPADTTDDTTVHFSTSAADVAVVDENGKVTATGRGSAVITAKMGSLSATCRVTVEPSFYTITFMDGSTEYMTMQFAEYTTVTNLPVPVREGYSFTGWYLDGALYEEGDYLTEDITLTAGWKEFEALPSPVCSAASGSVVEKGTQVTLSSPVAGAVIYYTVDGKEPTASSTRYYAPIRVNTDIVIKAIAVKEGYRNSPVATFTLEAKTFYTLTLVIDGTVYKTRQVADTEIVTNLPVLSRAGYQFTGWYWAGALFNSGLLYGDTRLDAGWKLLEPTCSVESGSTVPTGTKITLSAAEGATIYYTMDGRTWPTTASSVYTGPITLDEEAAYDIRAYAVKDGAGDSEHVKFRITASAPAKEEDKPWPFIDVAVSPGSWKYDSVKYVYENEIMTGIKKTDGTINTFEPDSPLTRGMFATVLYRMAGSPAVTYEARFSDVPKGKYYSSAVIWAFQKDIVNGYADGRFGVNDYITREQIAKMLMEYARVQGYTISDRANLSTFPDQNKVSGWATNYVRWAVGVGMISGKNIGGTYYLDPQGRATRAECAAMLMRFLNKYH